jgi:hypothetical protein
VDAGGRAAQLRFILIEDAGTLTGRELINDPVTTTEFHTIEILSGTHTGSWVVLHATLSGDTINATLDGGALSGLGPGSEPLMFQDGGPVPMLNLSFSMTQISTNAPS